MRLKLLQLFAIRNMLCFAPNHQFTLLKIQWSASALSAKDEVFQIENEALF